MTDSQTATDDRSTDERVSLVAANVTRKFGSVAVIDDVSLRLHSGALHALIGPNGSGKTTLLRLLGGMLEPTAGTVTTRVGEQRRTIGYLPQHPDFRPSFTALETLEFYASLTDDDPEALLARVGLSDAADRRVEDLSGGMTRLLGLAQAIAGDPPVVLLDEPGSGLDPGMRKTTISVARSLAAEGSAVFYSTHDLELAEKFCDRVTLVDGGTTVRTAPPEQFLEAEAVPSLRAGFESIVSGPEDTVAVLGEEGQ